MRRVAVQALMALACLGASAGTLARKGICVRVVDGDTLEVCADRAVHRVRLIGVDTPEKHESTKLKREVARSGKSAAQIQQLGALASKFTALAVQGRPVQFDYDAANEESAHKEKAGRLLAYVWFQADGKRVLLNGRIIRAGFGHAMTRYPYNSGLRAKFVAAEREARKARRGLWGKALPKVCDPKVVIVANRRSRVFHGPDCRFGKSIAPTNKFHFPSASAAREAGFRPCGACGGK